MDNELFLQQLRELPLEEGYIYIQQHSGELADLAAFISLLKGEALHQQYVHPFVSLKLAELLIFFGDFVQQPLTRALGLAAKGSAFSAVGQEQAAMDCLDAAGKQFLELGEETEWARTRVPWIISCAWLGRVDEALEEAARAREVFLRQGELSWVCVTDHNTAVIYSQIGQYQQALDIYDRTLAIYPTLTDRGETFIKQAIAMVECNQARNLMWLGDFERAYHLFQKAQASFTALGQVETVIKVEGSLADLDYVQGYYGSALRHYYQSRDSIVQHKLDNSMLARTTLQIASCLVKLNRAQEAARLAAESVDVYRQLGNLLDTGEALCKYAATLIASNRLKEAVKILDEASMLFNQGGFTHHATSASLQQAELLLEMGEAMAAYDKAAQLKKNFDAQNLVARSAQSCLVMASALVENVQHNKRKEEQEQHRALFQEATALCKQAAAMAGQRNLQEQGYKSLYLLGQISLIQDQLNEAEQHFAAAIEQIERILEDLVHDLKPSFLHTTWVVYEDMIALCLQQGKIEKAFSYLERARSTALRQYLNKTEKKQEEEDEASVVLRAKNAAVLRIQSDLSLWQQTYHQYSAQLASLDPSASPSVDSAVLKAEIHQAEAKISELFERLHLAQVEIDLNTNTVRGEKASLSVDNSLEREAIDVAQLRRYLLPGQLLLSYFLYKGQLVIFAVTAEKVFLHQNPQGGALLERLLPPLYAHLEPRGWPDQQQPPQQAIRGLLQKLYHLLIAPVADLLPPPSGLLTIVPYGLLHPLPFHTLYNGSRFLIEDFQVSYLPTSSLLAHLDKPGNSHAVSRPLVFGYSGNGELQRALDEAKIVAEMMQGRCSLEEEATIARLIEQAQGSSIIHLATHGQCRLDAPNFSYVRLADGPLNAIDAFSLNLEDCELVTLSGCETGLALSGGGDEQLGLGRAFLAAGASSLVMSLWPVEDRATSDLMTQFYQRLLSGDSKVQALRAAQCSFLNREPASYRHPYFWAAFRLVGEVGPLSIAF
ncbi:MAG TPA: CHAT domain-containing protein [Ktedonobacteraceae bacterium]|nr:CHAT domain-containing protein [Ktedonobacteraceae bacterium]